ncbi:MAG: cell division protein FtsZ [Myxococcales bacterium]|nr:cell division protein FtsZ [Myxococcales bacterium]
MITIECQSNAKIKVIGVGGGGGNAINNMVEGELQGVEFIACNTDGQALENSHADEKLRLGEKLTGGLGAGADPQIGWKSAMESQTNIAGLLDGSDMCFVTAGLGGGTGTGGAPVICQAAKDMGILTVAVVTMPFSFEGARRRKNANMGLDQLKKCVDTLIVIPNDRLIEIADDNMTMLDAFKCADHILLSAVRGISDIIVTPGLINVDFKDVRSIMMDGGLALMGQGRASGEGRALAAAQAATCSPLLDGVSLHGATGILVNITGGQDMTLREVNDAMSYVQQEAHPEANIIFGSVVNYAQHDEVSVTVIATGGNEARTEVSDNTEEYVFETMTQPTRLQAQQETSLPTVQNAFELPATQRRGAKLRGAPSQGLDMSTGNTSSPAPLTESPNVEAMMSQNESEYDTPAFLRRHKDVQDSTK